MLWPTDERLLAFLGNFTSGVDRPMLFRVDDAHPPRQQVDIEPAVRREVHRIVPPADQPGDEICVCVGSRGIAELTTIVQTVVSTLRQIGYQPVIIPAMGSHGGATASGQTDILASYGITSEAMGAEVRASMETDVIDRLDGWLPVHVARTVLEVGRAVLVARVKPHTDFTAPVESGLAKMAAVGLGKQAGAQAIHRHGMAGLTDLMPRIGRRIADRCIVAGVAVVEDADGAVDTVQGVPSAAIGGPEETALLERARSLMARLPSQDIDVLVIDRIGKQISGTGMDPNVIGRSGIEGAPPFADVRIGTVVALSLTPESFGNAAGIGMADFASTRLAHDVDLTDLYCNALTAGRNGLGRAKMPVTLPTDELAVLTAIATCGRAVEEDLRLVWIEDTLTPHRCFVTEAIRRELVDRRGCAVGETASAMPFDGDGRLMSFRRAYTAAVG
ncbi:MAG: DUF2088 domain-containing protein [Actinomycetota bacterium]|jgi:hypothetical protein|nr:DUF2088 domain-containing protein [Actinomycetota bacterium]MDA8279345.1 DUF2088 domain-containing protein [Actinomycetota bacterium]